MSLSEKRFTEKLETFDLPGDSINFDPLSIPETQSSITCPNNTRDF